MILVPATTDETRTVIDALLSLGSDLPIGLNNDENNNEVLQPIAPGNILPDPTPMVADIDRDDMEILDEHVVPNEAENQEETPIIKTDNKPEKRKGQLVVQNFQLARNRRPKCTFSCVGCPQRFPNNKELNDHFRNMHPPLTCSDCNKLFSTPSAFKKHKYKHYDYMYKCDHCNKGFHFESELSAH